MVLLDVFYRPNPENPQELDVLLKTNVGMWAYRNGMLVRDESYSLGSFALLPSIARLRKEHGTLVFSDIRTSQESDLYILLSGCAILAIENIPTSKKRYSRELRVIESLDGENKADMDAFLTLDRASWFAAKQSALDAKANRDSKLDTQENMVLIVTAVSAFTGLHPSSPLVAVSSVLIFISYIYNSSILMVATGVFSVAILIFLALSVVWYKKAEKLKADRLFLFVYVAVNIFSMIVFSFVMLPILNEIMHHIVILFISNIFISLMTGYLTLKMKYAKEKRVLNESVPAYVIKRFKQSLRL